MLGTMNAALGTMVILLISWFFASLAFCLALFGIVARRTPRIDEQMAAECEPALGQAAAFVLEKLQTV